MHASDQADGAARGKGLDNQAQAVRQGEHCRCEQRDGMREPREGLLRPGGQHHGFFRSGSERLRGPEHLSALLGLAAGGRSENQGDRMIEIQHLCGLIVDGFRVHAAKHCNFLVRGFQAFNSHGVRPKLGKARYRVLAKLALQHDALALSFNEVGGNP